MKIALRLVLVLSLVAAIAFLVSRWGRPTRERLTGYAREAADLAGVPGLNRAAGGLGSSPQTVDDEAIRTKIDETRRRLQAQLDAQLSTRADTAA